MAHMGWAYHIPPTELAVAQSLKREAVKFPWNPHAFEHGGFPKEGVSNVDPKTLQSVQKEPPNRNP